MTAHPKVVIYHERDRLVRFVDTAPEHYSESLFRVGTAKWPGMITSVVLLGAPADRAPVLAGLRAAYVATRPSAEVIETSDGSGVIEEVHRAARVLASDPFRLVVAEFVGGSRKDFVEAVAAVDLRSSVGWTVLLVNEPSACGIRNPAPDRWVVALGQIDLTRETRVGIREAMLAGVRTPEGIREVLAGAPSEWVVAYERAAVAPLA